LVRRLVDIVMRYWPFARMLGEIRVGQIARAAGTIVDDHAGHAGERLEILLTTRACRSAAPPEPEPTTSSTARGGFHCCAATGGTAKRQERQ
jgi:hypothetical protein